MKLHIKNMVCDRCLRTVKNILEKNNILYSRIELGEIDTVEQISVTKLMEFKLELESEGFELIDGKNGKIIERIKNIIIEHIHYNKNHDKKLNFSQLLENKLLKDYTYISNLFSETEGITIEKYIILQKVERVKELLVYDELSLSEIAFQMNYSSVAHLSSQFKKTTGLTPTYFRTIKEHKRKTLDKV